MGKYTPFAEWLKRQLSDRVEVLFDDIEDEDRIGVQLPSTAKENSAWWSNEINPKTRHYQCRAWSEAGWKVENVNLKRGVAVIARVLK
jgi:hypothetical protein